MRGGDRSGQEIGRDRCHHPADEKTLTDVEIEAITAKIVAEVAKKTGAVLRG